MAMADHRGNSRRNAHSFYEDKRTVVISEQNRFTRFTLVNHRRSLATNIHDERQMRNVQFPLYQILERPPSRYRDIRCHRRYSFRVTVSDVFIKICPLIVTFFRTKFREREFYLLERSPRKLKCASSTSRIRGRAVSLSKAETSAVALIIIITLSRRDVRYGDVVGCKFSSGERVEGNNPDFSSRSNNSVGPDFREMYI